MVDEAWASMVANLPKSTGKSLDEWLAVLAGSGLEKHGQLVALLKKEHGVTHGYANLIARRFLEQGTPEPAADDLVAAQYAGGKAGLKPIYDLIVAVAEGFGSDVEIAPRKTNVSLRRNKQFGSIVAASRSRIDLELNLPGEPPTERLQASGGMCSHRIAISSVDDIDVELIDYVRRAYDRS
ncbi:MAG: DUF4287 domain-containing protein [Thermomicrobiales bacterium]